MMIWNLVTAGKLARNFVVGSVVLVALLLTGCDSGPSEDGGIIGTGIILRGTVGVTQLAAGTVIEIKSSDAQFSQLTVAANNQFSTESLVGASPWVLRVSNGATSALYAIAYVDGTRNINSFSNVNLRNWFARQALDIDTEFDSLVEFTELPTAEEFTQNSNNVFQLISQVVSSYNLTGDDIINGDYIANDAGIDAFLDSNAAIIDNTLVTFVVTDPDTRTQSASQSLLSLNSDFGAVGTEAPSAPNSVRALGSSNGDIILVWEPSTDDVAVIGYRVVRDGELITTTPFPVFIDENVAANQTFTYEIIAVDNTGNVSLPSTAALSSALLVTDTTPPPAPTLLTRLSNNGSTIKLLWAQNQIGDVVKFNVFRGLTPQNTNFLLQVTGTLAADTTVIEGETFCYQVSAEDASGNESERSEVLCVIANSGNTDATTNNDPLPVWVVPNLDALVCNEQLVTAQILSGTTVIPAGCYQVPETLTIDAGATLRLTEGVVLKFAEGTKLAVQSEGTLIVSGTPSTPVVLTGELSIRGFWGGVDFQNSTSNGNLLRGAVIQFAGGGTDIRAGVGISVGSSRFKIEETLIQNNLNNGIVFNINGSVISEFTSNRITNNDNAGVVSLDLISSLSGNSDFTGNDNAELDIPRNVLDVPVSIPNLGVPIKWNGITIVRAALTIEPGVDILMINGASVIVDGVLSAQGTADDPINITGTLNLPGSWNGFNLSGRGQKTFDHVNISFAGDIGTGNGAVVVNCNPDAGATVAINNTDITDSASWGINLIGQGCQTEFGNNTFFNNALGNVNAP